MSNGKNSFSMSIDTSSIDSMLNTLADKADEVARPAAQAMAQVFYDEIKRNVSKLGRVTGNLDRGIYQVFSQSNSGQAKATYHVSWNHKKAPHGHLVEWGHIQRYQVYVNSKGEFKTAIRPEAQGKPKPRRNASQAEKDAYYVPLSGGPKQVAARPFVRPAVNNRNITIAVAAAEAKIVEFILGAT